jgi:hypothetical protein
LGSYWLGEFEALLGFIRWRLYFKLFLLFRFSLKLRLIFFSLTLWVIFRGAVATFRVTDIGL